MACLGLSCSRKSFNLSQLPKPTPQEGTFRPLPTTPPPPSRPPPSSPSPSPQLYATPANNGITPANTPYVPPRNVSRTEPDGTGSETRNGDEPSARNEEESSEVLKIGVSEGIPRRSDFEIHTSENDKQSQVLIKNATVGSEFLNKLDQGEREAIVEAVYDKPRDQNYEVITQGETGTELGGTHSETPNGDEPNARKMEVTAEVLKIGVSDGIPRHSEFEIRTVEKDKVSQVLIKNAIVGNEFLNKLDEGQIDAIVDAMYAKEYEANSNVITQGETGSHLYVSAEGEFEVFVDDKRVNSFGPGRAFGELAILYNSKRNATIRVVTSAKLWVLDRQTFQLIMMRIRLKDIEDKVTFLRTHPILKKLSREILVKISDLLHVEFFPAGHRIIRQGDKGDKFYMITGGSVKVTKLVPGADKEEEVGTLSHRNYFGELALLTDEPRQATVTALTPGVECLYLDRVPFIQLLGNLDELKNNKYGIPKRESYDLKKQDHKLEYDYIGLDELNVVGTLGVGGFGRVELVQYKGDNNLTFALKRLKKCYVVEQKQEEHAFNEKKVMLACSDCHFISKLYRTYRDNKYIYFLMEACLGGDVFTVLQKHKHFTESTARFMTGCVVEALHYLHDRGFVYRDLKPENLLLDQKGYVKMIDFGFAKRVGQSGKTWTFAGTPEYVAPEIVLNKGHDRAVDYWALGVLIHELLIGRPPFSGKDHMKTYKLILKGIDAVNFPNHMAKRAQNLVRSLCRSVATERLGYQKAGVQDIKSHKWFRGFNWEALRNRRIPAPIIPPIHGPTDLSNFEEFLQDKSDPPDETSGWDEDF